MDLIDLEELQNKNEEKAKIILQSFNTKYAMLFDFTEFNTNGQWLYIWNAIFWNLRDPMMSSIYPICLNSIRILTRDENSIKTNNISDDFKCLLQLANLLPNKNITEASSSTSAIGLHSDETIMESLKCLCNIIFLSPECRKLCLKLNTVDGILKRVSDPMEFPLDIEYFDMKLLFLITAFETSTRAKVLIELNGLTYFTEWLDTKIKSKNKSDKQIDVICEILKVMFNITTNPDKSPNENEIQNRHLTAVIRGIIIEFGSLNTEKERNVISNAINLLTNISTSCLSELIIKFNMKSSMPPLPSTSSQIQNIDNEFERMNIIVLKIFLNFLQIILDERETKLNSTTEQLPPTLTILIKCCRCNSIMRHYIRSIILPPLKDVMNRPEIGQELRNHLCRFLTLPDLILRDLSSELLFVCCKENVGRMIKYTGYGNSAGLLASRGVLDCRRIEHTEYSSDSEDSDTEEYKKLEHGINPVIGCYEGPKKNPMEGMSEERKEYEAMQLVDLMDKLQKSGIVQPCRIDEDGKPQPVDHILELQEELPQQQLEQKNKA